MNLIRALGLDRAIAYTFLARAMGIVGSAGTVLLIAKRLSPVEQGFYYTLLSLVSLQLVFELGFSFVLQQMAAHECVHLTLHENGRVSGLVEAQARLASILQLTVRWYTAAALLMTTVLTPAGYFFFHANASNSSVHWQLPWLLSSLASSIGLWATPFYSFLEGCGEVRAIAAMRFRQSVAAAAMAWAALLLHHGLYAPAMVIVGQTTVGMWFVFSHRQLLKGLLRYSVENGGVRWMREVWPFQWRIAVSWLCTYFSAQVFIPILFAARGAVEAGQMGMSLSVIGYMIVLALAWSSTKATPFGQMIARREFAALDKLFRRTLVQSMIVYLTLAASVLGTVVLLGVYFRGLADRMLPLEGFFILIAAAGANTAVQNLATLLRSFKREPFLVQSLAVAACTIGLALLTTRSWGAAGAEWSYLIAAVGIALPSALRIYLRARTEYLAHEPVRLMTQRSAA